MQEGLLPFRAISARARTRRPCNQVKNIIDPPPPGHPRKTSHYAVFVYVTCDSLRAGCAFWRNAAMHGGGGGDDRTAAKATGYGGPPKRGASKSDYKSPVTMATHDGHTSYCQVSPSLAVWCALTELPVRNIHMKKVRGRVDGRRITDALSSI